jgi:beta-lactamase regulating signal transducer with metallopeptidase domain
MFAVRGIAVSLSIFILFYSAFSVVVRSMWRKAGFCSQHHPPRRCADGLFALRMFPFVMALAVTLIWAVPSFLLLEPRAGSEPLGGMPLLLSLCGIAVMFAGLWNAAAAWARASRVIARWSREAHIIAVRPVGAKRSVSVLRSSGAVPPLTTAGILRSTVWLSWAAEFVLTERELQSSLRHEMVHVRQRDNLKKLLLRLVSFPGMTDLENAWSEATEMAADDGAVSSVSEALDLAAAVIKLSRLASLQPPAELTTALVHSPAKSVNARVERLISWKERSKNLAKPYSTGYSLCAAAATVAALAVSYHALLLGMHAATEWLVR